MDDMTDAVTTLGLLDDDAIQLDSAALQLAALDHPGVDLAPYVAILTAITERLVHHGDDAQSASDRAAALARAMARDHGLSGDRITYDDPDNADLIRVLDRRRGLPVSLAILYVSAARRVGWTADALNATVHVLVRVGPVTAPVLIDPFDDGSIVDAERLAGLLSGMRGHAAAPAPEHVAAMPNRMVLVRLLMNQATRAERSGDPARALTLYDRMTRIAPATAHAWWDRARLELVHGDVAAARGSLSAMLEMTRDPDLRMRIAAALDTLTAD